MVEREKLMEKVRAGVALANAEGVSERGKMLIYLAIFHPELTQAQRLKIAMQKDT